MRVAIVRSLVAMIACAVGMPVLLTAQSQLLQERPSFDVVSIKKRQPRPGTLEELIPIRTGGRFRINTSVTGLIALAYGLSAPQQIVGAPAWAASDTFTIEARTRPPGVRPPGDPSLPSLTTALREQLGFALEASRSPVEVIVVTSVEPPTEN
jgi:hypothetical protein